MINIFVALRNFFNKLFRKNNSLLLEAGNTEEPKIQTLKTEPYNENQNEKERFFDLYEKVINNEIDLYSLSEEDLKKIFIMIKEENSIRKKNNEELERINDTKKLMLEQEEAEIERLKQKS